MNQIAQIRFEGDLARLLPGGRSIGVAVSGGPDSLALLLLSAGARSERVEAATVDHQLRPESADEARFVAAVCQRLDVPHTILPVDVSADASLQAQARRARYQALARWAGERSLDAVLTAHHADDQAETLLMRLARGAGVTGLAGVRPLLRQSEGEPLLLVRPLLGWRKSELEEIVAAAGLEALDDPANRDPRHDRTRARQTLREAPWLDPLRLAASAANLADAEEGLAYAAAQLAEERIRLDDNALTVSVQGLPRELRRRLLLTAIARFGDSPPRGPDLDRALGALQDGRSCTLGSLQLRGGAEWRLSPAPPPRLSSRPGER